jgi:hypothetical protein
MSILSHLLIPIQSRATEGSPSETSRAEEDSEWGQMLSQHATAVVQEEHRAEEWGQMLADHAAAQSEDPEAEDEEE